MGSIGTGPHSSLRLYSSLIQSSSGASLGYETGLHQDESPRYRTGSWMGPVAYSNCTFWCCYPRHASVLCVC